jgi:hypothetical protein
VLTLGQRNLTLDQESFRRRSACILTNPRVPRLASGGSKPSSPALGLCFEVFFPLQPGLAQTTRRHQGVNGLTYWWFHAWQPDQWCPCGVHWIHRLGQLERGIRYVTGRAAPAPSNGKVVHVTIRKRQVGSALGIGLGHGQHAALAVRVRRFRAFIPLRGRRRARTGCPISPPSPIAVVPTWRTLHWARLLR